MTEKEGFIAESNSEGQPSEPTAHIQETSFEDVSKGCKDGCSGCLALIALLLFGLGFFGLRAAFQGNSENSSSESEARAGANYSTDVEKHFLKSESVWTDHIGSYFGRAVKGVCGLVAGTVGIIILWSLYAPTLPDGNKPKSGRRNSRPRFK